ncbi:hypothetical protein KOW79_000706 [Hemibagrus wyckioides]|uniref:Uncharacterized protein n=1 Tax=Hemibagrus wyckioides TaxID=337641 RepID=A0A9D3PAU8_9TELE|nr:hypothetical protein KOW79_000706 [Hemibagrus wyckioides]
MNTCLDEKAVGDLPCFFLCTESAFSLDIAGKTKTEEYHDFQERSSVLSNAFLLLCVMFLMLCRIIG